MAIAIRLFSALETSLSLDCAHKKQKQVFRTRTSRKEAECELNDDGMSTFIQWNVNSIVNPSTRPQRV